MILSRRAVNNLNWEYSLSSILDSAYNGIIAVDKDGYIVIFNKPAREIFRLLKDVGGMHIQEIMPESCLPVVLHAGIPATGQKVTINGRECIANSTPIIKDGEVVGAVAVLEDMNAFQEIIDEMVSVKESRGILETVLSNAHEGIVVTDKDGHIEICNEAFCSFLRLNKEKVMSKDISVVLPELQVKRVLETGVHQLAEPIQIKGSDVIVSIIPVFHENELSGAVGKLRFKPVYEMDSLVNQVNTLKSKLEYFKDQLEKVSGAKYKVENIVGKSQVIIQLKETIKKVANGDSTILLRGESGTGRELFAHAIHLESSRKHGPFVRVNCSAVPENLIDAELFGLAERTVSGTLRHGQIGKFELADQGTIFIDDIGAVSSALQAKIMNVMQTREIKRIGDDHTKIVDVRIIAATKQNLDEMVKQNLFREDLYYRLNVLTFYIPPLRDRREDIEPLINFMIEKYNNEYGKKVIGISSEVYNIFIKHTWPGNVREMDSVMERIFNVIEDQIIQPHHLPVYLKKMSQAQLQINDRMSLKTILEDTERNALIQALQRTGGNKVKAAKSLGISRAGLYQKLEKYHLLEE